MCGDDPNRPDLLPELLAIHKDVGLDVTQIALVASALQELRSTKLKCFMKLDEPDRWLQLVYATLYQLKASYSAAPLQLQDAAQVSQVTAAKEKLEAAEACTARLAQQRRQLSQALRTACQLVDIVDATTRDLLRAQSASKAGIDAALQRVKQPVVEPYRRAHAAITTHLVYGGHEHEGPYSLEPEQIAGSAVEGRTPDVPACEPANLAPTLQQLAECVASIPGMVASLQELAAQLAGEHAAAVATGVQAAGWLLTQAPTQHTPGSATPSGGATTPKAYSGRTHDNETAGPGVTAAQVWEAHEAYSRKTGRMPSSREECNEAICDYLKNARQAAGSGAGAGSQQHDVSDQAGSRSAPSQEDGGGTPDGDSTASPRPHDGLLLDPAALLTGSQLEADEAAQAVAAALPGGLQHKKRKADEGEAPGQDGKQRKVVDPDGTASVDETELTPQLPGSAVDSSLVPATMYSSGA